MNDDKKDNKPEDHLDDFEEEFEFETEPGEEDALAPEEFETEGDEAEPVVKETRKSMLLPIIIATAVVGFVGWKVVGMMTDPKDETKTTAKPAPKVEATAPTPAPTLEPIAPQSSLPSVMDAQNNILPQDIVATEDTLTKLQKKLEEQDNAIKQRISNLEKEISTASQNAAQANAGMNKLQNDLASLNAAVQELMVQLKTIHDEREKQQAQAAAKKRPSHKTESANPTLSVYAIIPGRAWLRSGNGKTITVTEGDNVGEYGKVLKIDAGNGVVVTSSGVNLR